MKEGIAGVRKITPHVPCRLFSFLVEGRSHVTSCESVEYKKSSRFCWSKLLGNQMDRKESVRLARSVCNPHFIDVEVIGTRHSNTTTSLSLERIVIRLNSSWVASATCMNMRVSASSCVRHWWRAEKKSIRSDRVL